MILPTALFALVQFLLTRTKVVAQYTNVTTCIPEFSWTMDAQGHTPCFTAAALYTACGNSQKFIQAIPPGTLYLGPALGRSEQCTCSSAVYMLTSACGACQGNRWTNFPNWTFNCTRSDINIGFQEGVPQGIVVPGWAMLNVTEMAGQTFDATVAKAYAATESSTTSESSSTSASSSPPVSPSSADQANVANSNEGRSRTNTGAIAGGVVGALIFIAIVGLLLFWYILRKRARTAQANQAKRALDLTASGPQNPHQDVEKFDDYIQRRKAPSPGYTVVSATTRPPLSVVGGLSWHSHEEIHHERQSSSGSGGYGQGYMNTMNSAAIPPSNARASPVPDRRNTRTNTIYTTNDRQRSVESFRSTGTSGPARGQTIYRNEKAAVLTPTGYTGAAEVT